VCELPRKAGAGETVTDGSGVGDRDTDKGSEGIQEAGSVTCIAGVVEKGTVYIGSDSIATNGWNSLVSQVPKVFRKGDMLIGYCGSFRMGQLIQYALKVEPQTDEQDDMEYLVTTWTNAVRTCFRDGGILKADSGVETGVELLIGYHGALYQTAEDFQVNRYGAIAAIGAGEQYALGALRALNEQPPKKRIENALKIAGELSAYVTGPYTVKKLEAA